MYEHVCVCLTSSDQVNILYGVRVLLRAGVRAYTQEEVTLLRSLLDFLVPSPVARKKPNLSQVHLSCPHR